MKKNARPRLYTDNILQNIGPLFRQWVLRAQIKIEDMRLTFLDYEQRKRLATVAEIEQALQADSKVDTEIGRLLIPDSVTNSPSYWKKNRL